MDIRNEGQRRLRNVDATQEEIAVAVGASQPAVSRWENGVTVPDSWEHREALRETYGIPPPSWDKAPRKSRGRA